MFGAVLGLAVAAILVATGTAWAYFRGANDFYVFFEAWRLVLAGKGSTIYQATPDRFLYAPGFAWLLAPIAILPRDAALALWCFGKAAIVVWLARMFANRLPGPGWLKWAAAAWGVVVVGRPLLIDFQYGQVNLVVLGACAWALVARSSEGGPGGPAWSAFRWFALGVAAISKLYALPLLLIPWISAAGLGSRVVRAERWGAFAGAVVATCLPVATEGPEGAWSLVLRWRDALVSRGLPTESHNQSFAALLHHYFTGAQTHIIARGSTWVELGEAVTTTATVDLIAAAWTASLLGLLVAWLAFGPSRPRYRWLAVALGAVILPSHLVWKPHFVLGIPAAIVAVHDALEGSSRRGGWLKVAVVSLCFLAFNFSGFDFIGYEWAGRLEAASIFLLAHGGVLAVAALSGRAATAARYPSSG